MSVLFVNFFVYLMKCFIAFCSSFSYTINVYLFTLHQSFYIREYECGSQIDMHRKGKMISMKANHITDVKRSGKWAKRLSLFLLALLVCALPACASAKYNARLRKGTRISIMGDSISTYAGWSDARPITGPECTNRYGEAYYGPKGGDYHNTDLLVSDTWWHQAASELGGEILVSNAGNSTGLLCASYPANAAWDLYLKEMLAYKTRPYYMGIGKVHPDIIALYIGSNELARATLAQYGSVDDVNFGALIQKTGKNSYAYAEPATVAEAYCILLHKLQVAYPKAEIYCFTVVPNAGGYTSTVNSRLKNAIPFNEMIKGVANHYGAFVVDIFDEFALDPDYDGVASDAAVQTFQSYFHNDPHPNAKGFDVITRRFVSTILENSRFVIGSRKNPPSITVTTSKSNVKVETSAGKHESVEVNYTIEHEAPLARMASSSTIRTTGEAVNYLTAGGNTVNYASSSIQQTDPSGLTIGSSSSSYTSISADGYWAEGGTEESTQTFVPGMEIAIPMDDPESLPITNTLESNHPSAPQFSGDVKESESDGTYDYTETRILQQGKISVTTQELNFLKRETTGTDMHYVQNKADGSNENNLIVSSTPPTAPENLVFPAGYDFYSIGTSHYSQFSSAHIHSQPMSEGDSAVLTHDGVSYYVGAARSIFEGRGLVVPRYYFVGKEPLVASADTGKLVARYDFVQHFVLADRNGRTVNAYCADKDTGAEENYFYHIENVGDATYYSAEQANRIRVVAKNGYWGASSGFGSLAAVKEMLRKSGKFSEEDLARLTDGMAMTATQYAIWTCSNHMSGVHFINAYYNAKAAAPSKAAPEDAADLIFRLFFHLLDLAKDAPAPDGDTSDTVITEKNFLQDVRVKLTGKPESHEDNLDDDLTNDVYTADLSFALGVKPLTGNDDDLAVIIEDGLGNALATGRISGELMPGEILLTPDGSDRYTFCDLALSKGSQHLSVRMKGTQDLKKDVYLFTSEVKDGVSSQTMVGVAEGDYGVNVEMNLFFTLDVEEDVFSFKRFWRKEYPLPVVPDEEDSVEVAAPQTGDSSQPVLFAIVLLCSAAAVLVLRRRIRRA